MRIVLTDKEARDLAERMLLPLPMQARNFEIALHSAAQALMKPGVRSHAFLDVPLVVELEQ